VLLLPWSASPSIINISSNVGHLIQRRCCLYVANDSAASIRRATVWNVLQYSVVGTRYYILIVELWINTGVAAGRRVESSGEYSFLFMTFWYTFLILANRIPAFYTTLHHGKFRVATQACRRNRHGLDTSKTKYLTIKNSTRCSLCVGCFVGIWEQTAAFALYIINWLVFVTVVESVYSAVRTDSLYKAD
jgi:hypothetical protein